MAYILFSDFADITALQRAICWRKLIHAIEGHRPLKRRWKWRDKFRGANENDQAT